MEQLRFPRHAEEASAECRYAWIEDRIRFLAKSFAVSVYSYVEALMAKAKNLDQRWMNSVSGERA